MHRTQKYLLRPSYTNDDRRCIGVLQQLQTLLSNDATLSDVSQVIQCFQQEFGAQELLENVIQSLVGQNLKKQFASRKIREKCEIVG